MKSKEVIKNKIAFLSELLENEEVQEEIIFGGRQRSNIRLKINLLNWVLE